MKVPLIGTENLLNGLLSGHLGQLSESQTEALMVMKDSTNSQLHLVHRLLEIYRYEVGTDLNRRILSARDLLLDCVNKFTQNNQARVICHLDKLDEGCRIWGDQTALTTLFMNLLDNAAKFSEVDKPVQLSAEMVDSKLLVQVHNLGNQMPEEVKSSMFSKFWQGVPGKMYVAKTGLGLYLCHRIAQLHHARITCESLDHGTTITVKLPVSGFLIA